MLESNEEYLSNQDHFKNCQFCIVFFNLRIMNFDFGNDKKEQEVRDGNLGRSAIS